jgi:hypothetical protein
MTAAPVEAAHDEDVRWLDEHLTRDHRRQHDYGGAVDLGLAVRAYVITGQSEHRQGP